MHALMRLLAPTLVCVVSLGMSFAQTSNLPATPDDRSLGAIAREYRQHKQANTAPGGDRSQSSAPPSSEELQDRYMREIKLLLDQGNLDRLEKEADGARRNKTRFPGGVWKLYVFYEALGEPAGGSQASDAEWVGLIETLRRWTEIKPESVTARVALAQAYLGWGYKARGHAYSYKVTEQGWMLLGERLQFASLALKQAAGLKAKCPHWYVVLLNVARTQGWEKAHVRAVFEKAIAFEPDYYHYYREYALYLMPKWAGEDGEAEAFAQQASNRISGKQAAFIYFEIATVLNCSCGDRGRHLDNMSWPKIKEGYAALEELYGVSNRKLNRFAYLAVLARDRAAASEAFKRIGENWDAEIWRSEENFEYFKVLAKRPANASSVPASGTN